MFGYTCKLNEKANVLNQDTKHINNFVMATLNQNVGSGIEMSNKSNHDKERVTKQIKTKY